MKQVMDIVNLDLSRETLERMAKAFNGITVSDANRRAGLINAVLKLVEKATNEQIVGLETISSRCFRIWPAPSSTFRIPGPKWWKELKERQSVQAFHMFVCSQLTIKRVDTDRRKGQQVGGRWIESHRRSATTRSRLLFENVPSLP